MVYNIEIRTSIQPFKVELGFMATVAHQDTYLFYYLKEMVGA
jgi:hypothetical protein